MAFSVSCSWLARTLVVPAALYASAAFAIDPFVIKDIRVEGLQRTEPGTVFSYLPVKVGDTMNEEKAAESIRALFATGFFRDVTLEVDGDVLVVSLLERPSIAQVDFVGVREFDKETLGKVMRQVGLNEGRIFDRGVLDRAEQELKRQYLARGKYAAEVATTVTPLERNRVAINFNVTEGDASKIRQISIIGAKAFRESQLLRLFTQRTPGLMTWYSKQDQYSRQKLSADLETLRSFYQDRGYLEFSIDSTQVSITPDKKDIYITIGITEGEKYTVSDIKIEGKLLLPEPEIRKLVTFKPGEVFSRVRLTESIKAITDRLGNDGYAFANVNAAPELNREKRQAAFTFFVDPGRRVYVRRINIGGNTRTRDEVIRREMRQLESAWYNANNILLSKQRIDRLGYFSEVEVETPAVQGTTDQVDVNFSVVEKPTGNVLLGAGFGSGSGVVLSGSISQNNIFGSGKHVSLGLSTSSLNTVYSLSYTDPYFTRDGVSVGYDIYHRKFNAQGSSLGEYVTKTTGAGIRVGVPISERDSIQFGLAYDATKITTFDTSPPFFKDYVAEFGRSNTALMPSMGWTREERDSLIYPMKGAYHRLFVDGGIPGGSLRYFRANYQFQRYFPLTRETTLMFNVELGYGDGYSGKRLPFFKNYFAGGVSSLRGYKLNTVAPRDEQLNPRGGTRKLLTNFEYLFPFPGLTNDRSVRLSAFLDAGTVYDPKATAIAGLANNYNTFSSGLRYSTGMSLGWVSPFGPLKFVIAAPLSSKDGDRKQRFQFTFGGAF
ncbi:MAG: outer membrane protein assembly factor BamA [Betaproteobacteria bacterium]|nr:outer membrane protein assembly factor BamA [Betaproteobacteria bacterium]